MAQDIQQPTLVLCSDSFMSQMHCWKVPYFTKWCTVSVYCIRQWKSCCTNSLKTCQSSVFCWELLVQFVQHSHNLGNVAKAAAASHTYPIDGCIYFIRYSTLDCQTRPKLLMRISEIFLFELRGWVVLLRSDRWITSSADNVLARWNCDRDLI